VLHDGEHCLMVRSAKLERTELHSRAEAKRCTVDLRHRSVWVSYPDQPQGQRARTNDYWKYRSSTCDSTSVRFCSIFRRLALKSSIVFMYCARRSDHWLPMAVLSCGVACAC
jgi:hypothetical protein